MKKLTTLVLSILFAGKLLLAQSVDEGRMFLYHGRTQSATASLNKVIASNPKNAEAIYWLGQTMLSSEDKAGARALYQKALNDGINDPLIWVGIGHVELLDGKKDAARQRFEAAITNSMSKKKENPTILNAIGRAEADGNAQLSDPAYAIEKLKRAAELDPKNADILVNLGINYLILGNEHGGDAYGAFTDALKIDPNNAKAKYRLGKIFQSQGNTEKFIEYYNSALESDPAYTPASLEAYYYYADRDVNKAREYLDKYVANADKDCNTDYFYADYLFRAGKYQESLDKAKAMSAGACATYPRLKVLYAYNYDRLGDSLQARQNIESYLTAADPTKVRPEDYQLAGKILLKFPGSADQASTYIEKAMNADTVTANKITYINTLITAFGNAKLYPQQLQWYRRLAALKPDLSNRDLYLYTDAAINAGQLTLADSLSHLYITKFPTQEYGYSLAVRSAILGDPDSTKGSAFPAVEQYITFLSKDPTANAGKIKRQYYYMAQLYSDKMKNYPKAIEVLEKVQALDPSDAFATQALPILRKAVAGPKSAPAKAAPKKTSK